MVKNMHSRRRRKMLPDDHALIECAVHPGRKELGYAVCIHVETVDDIHYFERATPHSIGEVSCAECGRHHMLHPNDKEYFLSNFVLACQSGLKERGLVPTSH